MKIKELIKKLQKAEKIYGNIDVLMEGANDVIVNEVCYAEGFREKLPHIRLTDDIDAIYDIYDDDVYVRKL